MGQDGKNEHRLAAIMATDVVGYSKLMQADEASALAALAAIRSQTENQIGRHRGRVANTAGDSVLAEFVSAVEAVSCAVALQEALSQEPLGRELSIRIGIHLGDVVDKGGDLFGTTVNVAARLEGIAQPGGIVVSAAVRDAIAGKLAASFADLGLKTLKNIEEPFRAFALSPKVSTALSGALHSEESLTLPGKPSIAVLPFDNLSGDREQEYFADGMVEEIITALSRFRGLFVIARNSSFTYKGRAVDVKQVGRELGVRYVLEGSIRKAGGKLRIAGQLIDTSRGTHLWADRFDGALEDVFALQDRITSSVVGAIAPKLEQAEIERAKRKPTDSLDAYDCYLRALATVNQVSREATDNALRMFAMAIERDPDFTLAYAHAAWCYTSRKTNGWMDNPALEIAEAERLAKRALELGRDDAAALCFGGITLGYVVGNMEDGAAFVGRALALNPNFAAAWLASGWLRLCRGEVDHAISDISYGMRLSPLDSTRYAWQTDLALAHFLAGRYGEAIQCAQEALRDQPGYAYAFRVLAASNAMSGRSSDALRAIGKLREADPQLRMSNIHDVIAPFEYLPEHRAKYIEGLRLAGLPE
jgi:TolB-like protein/class 3 adenylate cyclase/tetratricopeptide (TPR) repeat protein